jgi:hypothetical protein
MMRRCGIICGLVVVYGASAVLGQGIIYDSQGFEPPTYAPGPLAGVDGWITATMGGASDPLVVTAPDPVLGTQALRLEVPNFQTAKSAVYRDMSDLLAEGYRVFTVSFDIYRQTDLWAANVWWWWYDTGNPTYGLQWDSVTGISRTLPLGWNPGANETATIMDAYANLTLTWDFTVGTAYSWYNGVQVDFDVPITDIDTLTGWAIELKHDEAAQNSDGEVAWIDNFLMTGLKAGDLNCDGNVNNFDITPFVKALTATPPDYAEYYSLYPNCKLRLADINGDGAVNNFDITPFVHLLSGE